MRLLKTLDIFPKFTDRSVKKQTFSGGILTILTFIMSLVIFYTKIVKKQNDLVTTVVMDNERIKGQEKIIIDFDVYIHAPCDVLHIDLFEESGKTALDMNDNITRVRYDENGLLIQQVLEEKLKKMKKREIPKDYCGPCYGTKPKTECCNSCAELVDAIKAKGWSFLGLSRYEQCVKEGLTMFGNEKCRVTAKIKVKRGQGTFHIGLGSNRYGNQKGKHTHDLSGIDESCSMNHTFYRFDVGPRNNVFKSAIAGASVALEEQKGSQWRVEYYLHIVPSRIVTPRETQNTYQYGVMYAQKTLTNGSRRGFPGIYFTYDFSPMMVVATRKYQSIGSLFNSLFGLIAGAYSFAMILDALWYGALTTAEGKSRIGKNI